jgi:hypothetical protein
MSVFSDFVKDMYRSFLNTPIQPVGIDQRGETPPRLPDGLPLYHNLHPDANMLSFIEHFAPTCHGPLEACSMEQAGLQHPPKPVQTGQTGTWEQRQFRADG